MQAITVAPTLQADLSDITDDAVLAHGPTTTMTVEKARALVKMFADVTASQDSEAFPTGFTDDCIVWYPPDRDAGKACLACVPEQAREQERVYLHKAT
jgi:hypothetical protein